MKHDDSKTNAFETYKKIDDYAKRNLIDDAPSCFNGEVRVRRYKVTVEIIDEPLEVIQSRIKDLWDKNNNHHNWQPLKAVAKNYGFDL